ncbi:MAG: DUF6164 family protein [Gammaproteobacteria bacterium]|nr:DUF6164 family protein [Gammaproteobacteria bacterium]
MARLLLNLRNVPEDEAHDVRTLLDRNAIEYYETPPSRWGISMGGIWLREDDQYARARAVLDEYQGERASRAREDYKERKRRGQVETIADVLRRRPIELLAYAAVVAGIIALMMWPVWML